MTVLQTLRELLRHRMIMIAVLVVTLSLAGVAAVLVPVHYTSKSLLVLTTPPATSSRNSSSRTGVANPLLGFDSSLKTAVVLLVQTLSAPEVAVQLDGGARSGTTVKVSDGAASADLFGATGPFLLIEADSTRSGSAARNAVFQAVGRAQSELLNQQQSLGAPKSTWIVPLEVLSASAPLMSIMTKIKATIGALLAGLVLSLGAALVWRRLAEVRVQRPMTPEEELRQLMFGSGRPEPRADPIGAVGYEPL